MQDLIVLGQIPGTNWHFGFFTLIYLLEFALVIYIVKTYHPEKLKGLSKLSRNIKKSMKRPRRTMKSLVKTFNKKLLHFRNDILSPKLKFLK
jgi:hypothetical protein